MKNILLYQNITDSLPFNCEEISNHSQTQIQTGNTNNLKYVASISEEVANKIDVNFWLPRSVFLELDVKKIFTILIQNAYDSIQRSGRYSNPEISIKVLDSIEVLTLQITDNGIGFDSAINKISESPVPFGGNGSGLCHVHDLLHLAGGNMTYRDLKIGSEVIVHIPK